jgi:hypothetical protein
MMRWKHVGMVSALVFVSLFSAGWAETIATNLRLNGKTAIATFDAFDPVDSCLHYLVGVVSSASMQLVSPEPTKATEAGTLLAVQVLDECTHEVLLDGSGTTTQQTLVFNDLRSATLTATVPLETSTGEIVELTVNLTWSATGPTSTSRDVKIVLDRELGLILVLRQRGSSVPAVATGTVVIDDLGVNVTPEPSDTAEWQNETQGQLTIQMKE